MQRFAEGYVMIWTGRIAVRVSVVADPTLIDEAVKQLRGVGRLNAVLGAGRPLDPPDFRGC
jgi:hypothetical protein